MTNVRGDNSDDMDMGEDENEKKDRYDDEEKRKEEEKEEDAREQKKDDNDHENSSNNKEGDNGDEDDSDTSGDKSDENDHDEGDDAHHDEYSAARVDPAEKGLSSSETSLAAKRVDGACDIEWGLISHPCFDAGLVHASPCSSSESSSSEEPDTCVNHSKTYTSRDYGDAGAKGDVDVSDMRQVAKKLGPGGAAFAGGSNVPVGVGSRGVNDTRDLSIAGDRDEGVASMKTVFGRRRFGRRSQVQLAAMRACLTANHHVSAENFKRVKRRDKLERTMPGATDLKGEESVRLRMGDGDDGVVNLH